MLQVDATQSLGVRVEYTDKRPGLFVVKKDDVFRGQLAIIVSPDNLAAGAVILSADGVECKNSTELREHIEDVRKMGAKDIKIKLCLSRSIDMTRIDQNVIVGLTGRETIPLPSVKCHLNTVAAVAQLRATTENAQNRERSSKDTAAHNAEDKSAALNRSSTKRKEQDSITDYSLLRKRIRNDQPIARQTDAPVKEKIARESSSQSRIVASSDQQSDRQVVGHERNTKSMNINVPQRGGANVHNASKQKRPSSQNPVPKDASIQPLSDEPVADRESSVGRSITNNTASVAKWSRPTV